MSHGHESPHAHAGFAGRSAPIFVQSRGTGAIFAAGIGCTLSTFPAALFTARFNSPAGAGQAITLSCTILSPTG